MTDPDRKDVATPETPFPRHRYYYIALKYGVLLIAAAVAGRFLGWW